MYAFFYSRKCLLDGWRPRWPSEGQNVPLSDYEEIARVLSPIFSEDKKPVVLSGRACRERMNGLISKYLEEDKEVP